MEQFIAFIVVTLGGLFFIACAYFDWEWFMTSGRMRRLVALVGRKGARIIYAFIGLVLTIGGISVLFN